MVKLGVKGVLLALILGAPTVLSSEVVKNQGQLGLRGLSPGNGGDKGGGKKSKDPDDGEEEIIYDPSGGSVNDVLTNDQEAQDLDRVDELDDAPECEVQLVMNQPAPAEDDDDPATLSGNSSQILICSFDEVDENGATLYEVDGLDDEDFDKIVDIISQSEGRKATFAFPGASKSGKSKSKKTMDSLNSIDATSVVENPSGKSRTASDHRKLGWKPQGVSTIIGVRVDAADANHTNSLNDCRASTFGGTKDDGTFKSVNLANQTDLCSYGKLKYVAPPNNPAYPNLIDGVVSIKLTQNVQGVSHGTVLDYAKQELPNHVGDLSQYDHILYFMPKGVNFGSAAALGFVGGQTTWYHNGYSLSTGIQMHEVGHNIGLGHSGEDGQEYGDKSGYMGNGGGGIQMCYNAPKNWYLGWYSDLHAVYDPFADGPKVFKLVGLSDYDEAQAAGTQDYTVVLQIETYKSEKLWLTYNRKEKMNKDTKEFGDKVMVTRSKQPGISYVMASLSNNQSYMSPLVSGSGKIVEICACSFTAGSPDYATISIHLAGESPACTPDTTPSISSWPSHTGALLDDLVAYYPFDSNLADSSGHGHDGSVGGGSPTYVTGVVGEALSLNGTGDFVQLPNVTDLNFGTGDFTLTFWYRVSENQNGNPALIGNKDWSSLLNQGWIVSSNYGPYSNGDDPSINLSDGVTKKNSWRATDLDFNKWHFIAIRIQRGGTMTLLRSKAKRYDIREDTIDGVVGSLDSGMPILIGAAYNSSTGTDFDDFTKMDIDDLGIWKRALSSTEIEKVMFGALYHGNGVDKATDPPVTPPAIPMPTSTIAHYEFEQDLVDLSGYDHTASLQTGGTSSYVMDDPGHHLNLQSSYVTLPESSFLDFGSYLDFSVSLWMRTTADFSGSSRGTALISNKNYKKDTNPGWFLGIGSNGRAEFNIADETGKRCDIDGAQGELTDGEWHHLVATITRGSSGTVSVYLDGILKKSKSCILQSVNSGYPIRLGTDGQGGIDLPNFYTGDIDEVMLFNTALSHSNIVYLHVDDRDPTVPQPCTTDDVCNDGLFCNGLETCDTTTGFCTSGLNPTCDDSNVCTLNLCSNNECYHPSIDCDDGDACTLDSCDPVLGCQHDMIANCCGNGLCEPGGGESESSCSADCGPFALRTTFCGSCYINHGVMFNVDALTDIIITHLKFRHYESTGSVDIYTAEGSYADKVTASEEWTKIATVEVDGGSWGLWEAEFPDIVLHEGRTQAFYVASSKRFLFGSAGDPVSGGDDRVSVSTARIVGSTRFSGSNSMGSNIWNGEVHYKFGYPAPTIFPTPAPRYPSASPTLAHYDLRTNFCGGCYINYGMMFDVVALSDILINRIKFRHYEGTATVEIYTAPGTYQDKITDPTQWTLVDTVSIDGGSWKLWPTQTLSISVSSGASQAFYVASTKRLLYQNANGEPLSGSDAHLQVTAGKRNGSNKFDSGGAIGGVIWNGEINYSLP